MPQLCAIEWEDAYNGNHDWFNLATLDEVEPYIVRTTGFVVRECADRITVAMSVAIDRDSPDKACDLFTIPRAMIRRMTFFADPFAEASDAG